MNSDFKQIVDRWKKTVVFDSAKYQHFVIHLTVRNTNNQPDKNGVKIFNKFKNKFDYYLDLVLDEISEHNRKNFSSGILDSLNKDIYLFIPGAINSKYYDLMLILDFNLTEKDKIAYAVCFDNTSIQHIERFE